MKIFVYIPQIVLDNNVRKTQTHVGKCFFFFSIFNKGFCIVLFFYFFFVFFCCLSCKENCRVKKKYKKAQILKGYIFFFSLLELLWGGKGITKVNRTKKMKLTWIYIWVLGNRYTIFCFVGENSGKFLVTQCLC